MFTEDTVVLITGTSSGIGHSIAERFLAMGLRVSGVSRRETIVEESFDRGKYILMRADVTDSGAAKRVVEQTVSRFGKIDVFIHCAGATSRGPLQRVSLSKWNRVIDTNLKACYCFMKEIIPHMRRIGGGSVLLMGSIGAFVSWEGETSYSVAKTALLALARGVALENAKHNIRVNVLCPGLIDAPMVHRLIHSSTFKDAFRKRLLKDIPMGRLGRIDEVVDAAVFLSSKLASYITGTALLVDGGYCAR